MLRCDRAKHPGRDLIGPLSTNPLAHPLRERDGHENLVSRQEVYDGTRPLVYFIP
jgi:hypothetical protein